MHYLDLEDKNSHLARFSWEGTFLSFSRLSTFNDVFIQSVYISYALLFCCDVKCSSFICKTILFFLQNVLVFLMKYPTFTIGLAVSPGCPTSVYTSLFRDEFYLCASIFQHLLNHLHLQPKDSHGVNFSRVRMWTLNGW